MSKQANLTTATSAAVDGARVVVQKPIVPIAKVEDLMPSTCNLVKVEFVDLVYKIKIDVKNNGNGGGIGKLLSSGWSSNVSSPPATEERTILNGVTGMVCPRELLAILGPSGSGKSTLLSLLAGRLQGKYTGDVVVNGRHLSKQSMRQTGFVTQDDVLYPHLTVRETLTFCSLLRLPRTLTRKEKVEAAESVISELGLVKCQDTIIGNGFIRGVSGGERRRVSIGHEMLVNPNLLLLDEPTSGLDSTAAHRLVSTLVGLSRKGKAVVAAVHQPSSLMFQMFDKVLLLSEGSCLYLGRGCDAMDYFASVGFKPRFAVNPADFMLDLANGIAQIEGQIDIDKSNVKHTLISSYNLHLAPKVKSFIKRRTFTEGNVPIENCSRHDEKDYSSISWFSQLSILLHRSLKERRHEAFNSLRVFQVVAAALLAGAMWWQSSIYNIQDRLGLLFFMAIFWGVFPATNAVFAFPQERAIFIKERSSGMYSLSSYFMAKMLGDLSMELILPTIFTVITYWMAGLRPDPAAFILTLAVLLGYVLVAQGFGLMLGASIMDAKRASTLVTVIMLAFLLTGGFYVHKIPACLAWLKYTSLTFYCYRLLVKVQYSCKEVAFLSGSTLQSVHSNSVELLKRELEGQVDPIISVAALILMFVVYRLFAYAALRRMKT